MPYVRARVDFRNEFPRITRDIDELAKRSVVAAAAAGAEVAANIASTRRKTGRIAQIVPTPPRNTGEGWTSTFASRVFYAWFQEYGTLAARKRGVSRATLARRSSASGQSRLARVAGSKGVEPLGFMRAGTRAGRKVMLETTRGGLPR